MRNTNYLLKQLNITLHFFSWGPLYPVQTKGYFFLFSTELNKQGFRAGVGIFFKQGIERSTRWCRCDPKKNCIQTDKSGLWHPRSSYTLQGAKGEQHYHQLIPYWRWGHWESPPEYGSQFVIPSTMRIHQLVCADARQIDCHDLSCTVCAQSTTSNWTAKCNRVWLG